MSNFKEVFRVVGTQDTGKSLTDYPPNQLEIDKGSGCSVYEVSLSNGGGLQDLLNSVSLTIKVYGLTHLFEEKEPESYGVTAIWVDKPAEGEVETMLKRAGYDTVEDFLHEEFGIDTEQDHVQLLPMGFPESITKVVTPGDSLYQLIYDAMADIKEVRNPLQFLLTNYTENCDVVTHFSYKHGKAISIPLKQTGRPFIEAQVENATTMNITDAEDRGIDVILFNPSPGDGHIRTFSDGIIRPTHSYLGEPDIPGKDGMAGLALVDGLFQAMIR